jgi:N-acetylmuramoyl-L-alanine amidase
MFPSNKPIMYPQIIERRKNTMLKPLVMKKTSSLLVFALLFSMFFPILAFAATGFKDVSFNGQTVSGTVYTDSSNGVSLAVYGPDGSLLTTKNVTDVTYYNVTNNVYEYYFSTKVTSSVYSFVTVKETISASVYQAVYDTTAPTWTNGGLLTASEISQNRVKLTWSGASDNLGGTVTYNVYRGSTLLVSGVTNTVYDATNLTPGTTYTFSVQAVDAAGNISTNGPQTTATTLYGGCGLCGGSSSGSPGAKNEIEAVAGSTVAKESLEKAFADSTNVTVKAKGDSAVLSAAGLVEAAKKSGTSLTIVTENGTYVLPLSVLKLDDLAKKLGIAVTDLTIRVEIKKVTGDTATAVAGAIKGIGAVSLTDAIDFNVVAESKDGKKVSIELGNTYVSRSVVVKKALDKKKATGVLYDTNTKKLKFVPATFVTDKDGNTTVTLKRNGNSIYTVVEMNKSFSDLSGHWAKDDVTLLANKLIVDGVSDTMFEADRDITRAEFTALVVRSLGVNTSSAAVKFSDVKADAWYASDVATAVEAGIINGYEDNTFRPDASITREELAAMVVRALKFAGVDINVDAAKQTKLLSAWKDADKIVWAKNEVAAALEAGIVNGMTDTNLEIGKQATRAESVTMLKRFLNKAGFID